MMNEQVSVVVDTSEAEDFIQVASRKLSSMPYGAPGQAFVAFQKTEGRLCVGKFSNILKFRVKEVILRRVFSKTLLSTFM